MTGSRSKQARFGQLGVDCFDGATALSRLRSRGSVDAFFLERVQSLCAAYRPGFAFMPWTSRIDFGLTGLGACVRPAFLGNRRRRAFIGRHLVAGATDHATTSVRGSGEAPGHG